MYTETCQKHIQMHKNVYSSTFVEVLIALRPLESAVATSAAVRARQGTSRRSEATVAVGAFCTAVRCGVGRVGGSVAIARLR